MYHIDAIDAVSNVRERLCPRSREYPPSSFSKPRVFLFNGGANGAVSYLIISRVYI